jgi:osmotically-inducible protein OsmY
MTLSNYVTIGALTFAMAMPLAARPGFAQTTPRTGTASTVAVDDSTLKDRVEAAIKARPTLKDQNIDVDVANKVVTLTGYVQTAGRKTAAAQAAKVAGVTRVDNQLVVDAGKAKGMGTHVTDASKTAAHKTGDAAETVGAKTKEAASATGGAITDAMINTKIHAKMLDEATLKGSDINVDVNNHVVTLKGTVASQAGKARAEEIARTTDGVKSVSNMLTIGAKK